MKTIRIACETKDRIPLEELTPLQGKLKKLPKANYNKLKNEILATGFAFPFYVWKGPKGVKYIIGGHQRLSCLQGLQKEGYALPEVPVVFIEASSINEAKRRVLQDVSQYGEIDKQGLYEFMIEAEISIDTLGASFHIPDGELDLKGFRGEFFSEGSSESKEKEGDVPPVPKKPKTKLGDVYQLGNHRLICGDSTDEATIKKLMNGELADMVWTDPPYNVDYDPESRASYFSEERKANKLGKIKNDKKTPEAFRAFLDAAYTRLNESVKEGGGIYICHADTEGHHFRNAFIAQPWKMQSCLIWKKTVLVFGRADYHWMHEPILYGWKKGKNHKWVGGRKNTTILEYATDHYNKKESDTDGYVHPTQKPVGLIQIPMGNSSEEGDIVLDLFGGSGSTMICAEKLNRRAFLCELDPHYCDVIVTRWEKFTGKKAVLQKTILRKK